MTGEAVSVPPIFSSFLTVLELEIARHDVQVHDARVSATALWKLKVTVCTQ